MNGLHLVRDVRKANAVTHAGKFHADDVLATILVVLLLGKVFLARVSEVGSNITSRFKPPIIYDIGGGTFDHHQAGAPIRENGVRYAAFGLLWKAYGPRILREHYKCSHSEAILVAEMLDKDFVQGIDYEDNKKDIVVNVRIPTICLSTIIAGFNTTWEDASPEAEEEAFIKAIDFAYTAFNNMVLQTIAKLRSKPIVEHAIEESKENILVLPRYVPWKDWLLSSNNPKAKEILYVIFPSKRIMGYDIMSVPKRLGSKFLRKPFPDSWAGLEGLALAQKLNVPMAQFCHLERYMASANSIDAALTMAKLSMTS